MAVYTIQPTRKPHQTREPRGLLPSGGKTQANSHGVQVPCIDGALALPMQSEEAQPLLFVGGGLDGLELVAGGGDGRAEQGFVQRLFAENDGFAFGMGGSYLFNRKGVADGVVDVGLAHAARHAVDFERGLDHGKVSFRRGAEKTFRRAESDK